ncbi:MAG: cytochrome c3 family protein [bacterium]|nr:cytochrome c3 family protein [bacterium]
MKFQRYWIVILAIALVLGMVMAGCGGSDGSDGSDGKSAYDIAVDNGFTGTEQEWLDTLAGGGGSTPGDGSWFGEYCNSCHEQDGLFHQVAYDQLYRDGVVQVGTLAYSYAATEDVVTFPMTKNGNYFDCEDADSLGIYFTPYTGSGFELPTGRLSIKGTVTYNTETNVCTSTKAASALGDLSALNGFIVVYGRDETIAQIPGTRIRQARYPFAAVLELGTVGYTSAANNAGCEKCHTVPFLKHGYIFGETGAGTDFYVCKACHLDDGDGGHFMWQLLVDDPQLIITLEEQYGEDWEESGDARLEPYAYKISLMNDVHMSHAMELPYPQSMSNCATCHEGKLTTILDDANFVLETCKSCHPMQEAEGNIMDAPALLAVMPTALGFSDHSVFDDATDCTACHNGGNAFVGIHTGYDPVIYTDALDGSKIADSITVSIDSASASGDTLTIAFSATGSANGGSLVSTDIMPGVLVGLYGMDTKDYLVGPHARDVDGDRNLEFDVVGSAGGTDWNTDHPRLSVDASSTPGSWVVTADLTHWAGLIDDGTIRRAEIAVLPELTAIVGLDDSSVAGSNEDDDYVVALNAVTKTFDLVGNTLGPVPTDDIVRVQTGCNNCHDALGTTFHGPDRGGSIVACRLCHITLSGGSHLEMQSRSIDSYVHAIHSFQPFDVGRSIDFTDPVEELHYEHHIGFVYPTLGFDCESCHNPGTYDVPSQSDSMPGLISASRPAADFGWERDIVDEPEYVTGPAARACGACHKAGYINHDDAAGLWLLNQHFEAYGYLWENDSSDVILNFIIDSVFSVYAP